MYAFAACFLGGLILACSAGALLSDDGAWRVHDMNRPQPPVVRAGTPSSEHGVGNAPSDALVLFDGTSLDAWTGKNDTPPWDIVDGAIVVVPGSGDMVTRKVFGDIQYHMEWMVPADRRTSGQKGGNSGLFLMDRYEIQILDSHENRTYADGMAGSFYGQHPPGESNEPQRQLEHLRRDLQGASLGFGGRSALTPPGDRSLQRSHDS